MIRAGLLGVADHVELLEVVDPLDDLGGVIDIGRRAESLGQLGNADAGDLRADRLVGFGGGHG